MIEYSAKRLRYLLAALFAIVSVVLVARGDAAGPLRSTANIESCLGTLLLVAMVLGAGEFVPMVQRPVNRLFCLVLTVVALPFAITVRSPFLFDSYSHIVRASEESFLQAASSFYSHPVGGDFFFRPLGYLDYWLESRWALFSPIDWRLGGLFFHLVACFCIYFLCRKTNLSKTACLLAALIFGLHGSNPEVVSWTAARFDELAICFSVATLIFLCCYVDGGRFYMLMISAGVCAMLSKEAAFCIPGLAVCLLVYRGTLNRRSVKALVGLALADVVVLVYRFWVLGGVGGYKNAAGAPTALQFNLLHSLELLFFRMWSVLVIPINWSAPREWWLSCAVVGYLIALCVVIVYAAPDRRKICAAIGFCWIAILPAVHLALLDSTLLGSRVYHLALVGLGLLVGAVYDGMKNWKTARAVAVTIVLFQAAVLSHNLLIWRDTAEVAGRVCSAFPVALVADQDVVISNLPKAWNGVFFLSNGFAECVFVNSGKRINVLSDSGIRLHWDQRSECIVADLPTGVLNSR